MSTIENNASVLSAWEMGKQARIQQDQFEAKISVRKGVGSVVAALLHMGKKEVAIKAASRGKRSKGLRTE